MSELKTPDGVVYVTPMVCSYCHADMGSIIAEERNTNKYLCKTKLNFLCPEHHAKLLDKVGLST